MRSKGNCLQIRPLWQRARRWGALALLLTLPVFCHAAAAAPNKPVSQYARDYWGVTDGLPQLGATAVAQDNDGYLWFGSLGGLSRFDGIHFSNYYPSTTPALQSAQIRALLPDPKGRLWIGTARGLTVYRDGAFSTPPVKNLEDSPTNVDALALDLDGRLLVGSRKGMHVFDDAKGLQLLASIGPVRAIAATRQGIWAGDRDTIYHLDGEDITPLAMPAPLLSLAAVEDTLWAATLRGVYRLQGRQWVPLDDPLPTVEQNRRVFKAEGDSLWVVESSRLLRVVKGHVTEAIELTPDFPHAAEATVDRDGNLWLTSSSDGVMRLWPGVAWHYPLQDPPPSPLVWTVARQADGSILAGGVEGIRIVRNRQLEPYIHAPGLPAVYTLMVEGHQLWAGTLAGAVLFRDGKRVPRPALAPLDDKQVTGFLRDPADNLLIATSNGVYRLDAGDRLLRLQEPDDMGLPHMRVLLRRHDGQMLAGGRDGLFRVEGDQLRRMPLALPDPDILALHELATGELLMGSISQDGLSVLIDKHWVNVTSRQGLPAHHIPYAIVDDGKGNILVSGFQGVYRVAENDLLDAARDPARVIPSQVLLTQNNRIHAGQRAQCCNGGGLGRALMEGGKLWVPASNGLYQVDADFDADIHIPPTAVIERVRVGQQWRPATGDDWVLPPQERDLGFEFNVLGFDPMHTVQTRYRLVGYDSRWLEPDAAAQHAAQYTNLPPGFYTFEVVGSWAGESAQSTSRLTFEIKPYFHETLAFKAILGLGLLMVGALLARLLSVWNRHRRDALEKLIAERTSALNDVNRELDSISRTDTLTGLYNRRHVTEQIPRDLAVLNKRGPLRDEARITLFALIDIDHFKTINDTFGHDAGDEVLAEAARRLSSQMRAGDYIARWGGEEFLAVLHGHTRGRHAAMADRLLECIRGVPFQIGASQRQITISIGMTELPVLADAPDLWSWEQCLWLADMAMYGAKKNGRDAWAIYQPTAPGIKPAPGTSPRLLIARNELVLHHSERTPPHG